MKVIVYRLMVSSRLKTLSSSLFFLDLRRFGCVLFLFLLSRIVSQTSTLKGLRERGGCQQEVGTNPLHQNLEIVFVPSDVLIFLSLEI
ncbi:hypothetical protein DFH29DRAFT_931167, partial [Suillus ampliporus]